MGTFVRKASELAAIIGALQSQGKTVVYTSGVFDLLHVGQTRALKDARSRGDYLVVGVHTDAAVRKRMSGGRPLLPDKDRVECLQSLEPIDYITIVRPEDCDELMNRFKPDILATGADDFPESAEDRKSIAKLGEKVCGVGDRRSLSSARLIKKIQSISSDKPSIKKVTALRKKSATASKTTARSKTATTKKAAAKKKQTKRKVVKRKVASRKVAAKTTPSRRKVTKRGVRSRKPALVGAR